MSRCVYGIRNLRATGVGGYKFDPKPPLFLWVYDSGKSRSTAPPAPPDQFTGRRAQAMGTASSLVQ